MQNFTGQNSAPEVFKDASFDELLIFFGERVNNSATVRNVNYLFNVFSIAEEVTEPLHDGNNKE